MSAGRKSTMSIRLIQSVSVLLALFLATAHASEDIRATNQAFVAAWHADNLKETATNSSLHSLPRVRVDLAAHTVSFYAEATGNSPREPVEFFLIGEQSGNAYEAIAVALADPAQINSGLQMLGMPPGRSADPVATRFWPKGERVIMTFNGIRAETLIRDSRTGKPLAASGFVYTGSSMVPTEDGTATVLAAQTRPPYSIASNYNEPDSLLDVPWQAPQTAVYSHQILNTDFLFKPGERILVVISPEYPDGKRRVQDLHLTIGTADAMADGPLTMADARFSVTNQTSGTGLLERAAIDRLLATFTGLIDDGRDPFVEVSIQPETTLGLIRQTTAILKTIDSEKGIRIEPPPPGDLYYHAFIPNEAFRHRRDRYIQPWELHLDATGTGVLTRIDEQWTQGELKPTLTTEDIPVGSAENLLKVLSSQNIDVRGIYVFAPPDLTYERLMRMIRPVLPTHPHIHVYLEEKPAATTTPPLVLPSPNPDPPAADPPSPS